MKNKISDIYLNFTRKTIEQKADYKLFGFSLFIFFLVISINVYIHYYIYDPKNISLVTSIVITGFLIAFSPQYINNTKLVIKNNHAIIIKNYLGGLYIKKEKIDKKSIVLAKVITKEYDDFGKENGSQIRYWIASSKYSDFNIIRIRKEEDVKNIRKSMNTILDQDINYRIITIEKTKPNKFINN